MAADVMKAVDRLLKDREKFESWLARLESEKSSTSEQAYERVRKDYQRRLDDVLGKLRTHAEALKGRVKSLEDALSKLEGERAARREELEEARLRRSVGEYVDDEEWSKLESRLQSALEETEGQLEATGEEITRLREIVAQVTGARPKAAKAAEAVKAGARPELEAGAAAEVAAAEEAGIEPEPQVSPQAGAEPVTTSASAPPAADEGHVSLGELVLEDEDLAGLDLEPATIVEPAGAEPEAASADVGDELAFLESLSLGGGEESDSFSFLEDRGSGTPQTIICPHCSAANDPAEWYCTECGEELPAE